MKQLAINQILNFNLKRMTPLLYIIIIVSVILEIINFIIRLNRMYFTDQYHWMYMFLYTLAIFLSVITIIYIKYRLEQVKNDKWKNTLFHIFISLAVLYGAALAYFDIQMHGHLIMFLIIYFLVNTLFILRFRFIVPLSLLAIGILIVGVYQSNFSSLINVLYILMIISIFFVGMVTQFFVSSTSESMLKQQVKYIDESARSKQLAMELEKVNEKLTRLALYDSLTELPNRHAIVEMLRNFLSTKTNLHCTIFIVDIDFFKQYNDFYGHPKGDAVLGQVAKTLNIIGKRENIYFARWGGEEFLGIAFNATGVSSRCANVIVESIEKMHIENFKSNVSTYVTVSVGAYSEYISSPEQFEMLYDEADKLLYEAKRNGRNGFSVKE